MKFLFVDFFINTRLKTKNSVSSHKTLKIHSKPETSMIEQFKMGELAKFMRGEGLRVSKKRNIFYDTNRNSNALSIF